MVKKVFDLLSTGCPFNFNDFRTKKGAVVQTLLAQIDVVIHLKELNNCKFIRKKVFFRASYSPGLTMLRQGYSVIFI